MENTHLYACINKVREKRIGGVTHHVSPTLPSIDMLIHGYKTLGQAVTLQIVW